MQKKREKGNVITIRIMEQKVRKADAAPLSSAVSGLYPRSCCCIDIEARGRICFSTNLANATVTLRNFVCCLYYVV